MCSYHPAVLGHLFADTAFFVLVGIVGVLIAVSRSQREQIWKAYIAVVESGEALRESEVKYRGLVYNIKSGVFRSTPEPAGRFLEVNPATVEITGYSRKELLQMNVSDLYVHPEERKVILEEIVSGKGNALREIHFRKKDGTEIVVLARITVVGKDAGKVIYFDGIMEDIT